MGIQSDGENGSVRVSLYIHLGQITRLHDPMGRNGRLYGKETGNRSGYNQDQMKSIEISDAYVPLIWDGLH